MFSKQGAFVTLLCLTVLLQFVAVAPASANYVSLTNTYVGAHLGVSGTIKVGDTEWPVAGRWAVTSVVGDPETPLDDGVELIYFGNVTPAQYFGVFKVKVGQTVYVIGDTTTGRWSETPVAYPIPRPGLGLGTTGGYIQGIWETTSGTDRVSIKIRMSLVRDQVRLEFTLTNGNATTQSVGLEVLGDVTLDNGGEVKNYTFIPGTGAVMSESFGVSKPYGMFMAENSIPNSFDIYDDIMQPGVVVRSVLGEQDATRPNYVAIGERNTLIADPLWLSPNATDPNNWRPDPRDEIRDIAWLMCWKEKGLSPGATRKVVTYYGVGAASAVWTSKYAWNKIRQDSAVLAVQGPRALDYNSVLSPASVLSPDPFEIKAYVYNLATDPGEFKMDDVSAFLYLPPGLELVSSEPAQFIGSIANNSESLPVAWSVRATGDYCGELTYYVVANSASGWQQIVSRKIMVPATRKNVFRSGWQLMSVPFTFNNPLIENVFSPSGLTLADFRALYYHPVDAPDYATVTQTKPGQGFWMYVYDMTYGQVQPFEVAPDAAVVGEVTGVQMEEQHVQLSPGWNMIGNPFVYPVYWGQVQVYNPSALLTASLDDAVAPDKKWLNKTLWNWNSERRSYDNLKTNDALLMPWKGYWVYANYPVTLIFRPAVFPGASVSVDPGGF